MKRLLITAALCAVAAFPQGPGGPGGRRGGDRAPSFDSLKTYLSLTDAQITSLTQLQTQRRTEMQTLMTTLRQKNTAIQTELAKAAPDGATLGRLMLDLKATRTQATTIATRYRTQATAVLTAPQKTKIAALEEAAKLRDEIHEAAAAGLLAPPDNAAGAGFREFGGGGGRFRGGQPFMRSAPQ